jgi:hypothetical protein
MTAAWVGGLDASENGGPTLPFPTGAACVSLLAYYSLGNQVILQLASQDPWHSVPSRAAGYVVSRK